MLNFFIIAFFLILLFLGLQGLESFLEGFRYDNSLGIKNQILYDYINATGLPGLIFGTGINLQFDAEFGYWLGFGGILAVMAIFFLYARLIFTNAYGFIIFLPLLVAGFGNSQLYGLQTATLVIPAIVLIASISSCPTSRIPSFSDTGMR